MKLLILVLLASFLPLYSTIQLLVPFYLPLPDEVNVKRILNASLSVSLAVIINTNNGLVDDLPNIDYQNVIKAFKEVGILVLGYTDSNFGVRSLNEMLDDIESFTKWNTLYSIDGIFIDKASHDLSLLEYYKEIYNYTHSKFGCTSKIFTNPGIILDEQFFGDEKNRSTDTAVIFDDRFDKWDTFEVDGFIKNRSPSEFAVWIHTCPTEEYMYKAIRKAANDKIEYIYVTDRIMNNPFNALPTYFEKIVEYVAINHPY